MRIALVATGGFDRSGRVRIIPSLVWLVERLARRHDVFVYVLRYHDAPTRYTLAGATIQDLGRPQGLFRQFTALRAALRADGPFDVVHGYWAHPAGLLASLVARVQGTPSVVTCDSGEFVSLPAVAYGQQLTARSRLAVRAATRLATCVTVCSEYQARLARAHGVSPVVIPLGVDTQLFVPRGAAPLGPPYRLLHVASLNAVKSQATLLEALHRLRAQGLDVSLDIVGEDTMESALRQRAHALELDGHVRFHGFRASDEVLPLYRSAHLFVLPSLHEAAGVVLLEAAACGLPIAGSDVGYLSDWKAFGAAAVPAGDVAALTDTIGVRLTAAYSARSDDARIGAWARAHDADWSATRFEALYASLAARHRG